MKLIESETRDNKVMDKEDDFDCLILEMMLWEPFREFIGTSVELISQLDATKKFGKRLMDVAEMLIIDLENRNGEIEEENAFRKLF